MPARRSKGWQDCYCKMPTRNDIERCKELWPKDWQEKNAFYAGQVATLLDAYEALQAQEQALADAMPFLQELASARTSMLDEDDVLIKVSPGRAAWVISRARMFVQQLNEQERGDA